MRSLLNGSLVIVCTLALAACQSGTQKGGAMETMYDSASYAIGMNSGAGLKELIEKDSVAIDLELLLEGLRASVEGTETRFSDSVSQMLLATFQMEMNRVAGERTAREGSENMEKGNAFLAENRGKEGVQVTESGLQYKVLEAGSGESPDQDDIVSVEYKGTLIDGTEFDASQPGNPVTFPVNGVIPGWTEALQMMKPGAHWQLFIPSELAYGPNGSPGRIAPNSVLIFDVKLISVEKN